MSRRMYFCWVGVLSTGGEYGIRPHGVFGISAGAQQVSTFKLAAGREGGKCWWWVWGKKLCTRMVGGNASIEHVACPVRGHGVMRRVCAHEVRPYGRPGPHGAGVRSERREARMVGKEKEGT